MSVWRTIPGFPGYAINGDGDIINKSGYMLTRTGRKKDAYYLVCPDGKTAWTRIPNLMRSALENGNVIQNPQLSVTERMPNDCVPIPDFPQYSIDREGNVWSSTTRKPLIWQDRHNARSPYVTLFNRKKAVNMLLEITFGKGAAEAAGLPPWQPRESKPENIGKHKNKDIYDEPKPKRRCHDCGTPTDNYRCKNCRDKWRRKNRVADGEETCETSVTV